MSLCTTNIAFGVSLANNSNPHRNVTARKMNRISSSLPPRAICNKKGWRSSASLLVNVEVTER
jgi:hypothetical protein